MSYKSIKKWPEDERPRERLLRHGAQSLSDAQLLAIILRTGGGGKSALELAMEILQTFENLKNMEQASVHEFSQFKGMGNAKIAQIKAALEIGKRFNGESVQKGLKFFSANEVFQYYRLKIAHMKKEVFHCAMLDAKNRIIRDCRVSEGTLTNSLIHPREAFRDAIKESAASVIFVHNHPSGDPTPSNEDIIVTEKLVNAGNIVGIKVLDHVIIGDNQFTSMMEKGYIKKQ